MTIFIGPNNSGKTYAAMMFYSLFRSYWHVDPGPPIWPPIASKEGLSKELNTRAFLDDSFCYDTISSILSRNPDVSQGKPFDISPAEAMEIGSSIFQKVSLGPLTAEIVRIYGTKVNQLARNGKGRLAIGIQVPDWSISLESSKDRLIIRRLDGFLGGIKNKKYNVIYWETINGKPEAQSEKKARIAMLGHALATESLSSLWLQLERGCHYFPGERAGLMLLGSPFIGAILQQKVLWENWQKRMSILPRGADSDFFRLMSELVGLNPGVFSTMASEFETEILAGSIQLTAVHKSLPPSIKYQTGKNELLLHQCSSTISELAPMILYLRYLAQPNSILIIDEPEAHLHPQNQKILAKYLVRLVRAGVNLIITTHSEYLLSRLSNFVMLGGIKKDRRKELGESFDFGEDDYLTGDEIGVYRFKYDGRSKAYVTRREEATKEGLYQGEFGKVDEGLYEEGIRIENELSR